MFSSLLAGHQGRIGRAGQAAAGQVLVQARPNARGQAGGYVGLDKVYARFNWSCARYVVFCGSTLQIKRWY